MPTRQEIYETTYVCDPKKATDCPKTSCFYLNGRRGGLCRCTRDPAQAARDSDGNPMLTKKKTRPGGIPERIWSDKAAEEELQILENLTKALHDERDGGTDYSADDRRNVHVDSVLSVLLLRTSKLRKIVFFLAGAVIALLVISLFR